MDPQEDNPKSRLEQMLRRWGADEAARGARIPPAPVRRRSERRRWTWLRWASLAAAAGLLLAAFLVHGVPWSTRPAQPEARVPSRRAPGLWRGRGQPGPSGPLRAGEPAAGGQGAYGPGKRAASPDGQALRAAQAEVARLHDQLDRQSQVATQQTDQLHFLRKAMEAQSAELKKLAAERKDVQDELARQAAQAKQAQADLTRQTAQMDELRAAVQAAAAKNRKVTQELAGLRASRDQARTERDRARVDLAAARQANEQTWGDIQAMYLARVGEGKTGLAARQAASRHDRLADRCGPLRSAVTDAATRRLLDQLEVVLTRLEIMDVHDPQAASALAALVRSEGLVAQIDRALASASPPTRSWLVEVRLVLTGLDGAA